MKQALNGAPQSRELPRSKGVERNEVLEALVRKLVSPMTPLGKQNGTTVPASNLVNYVVGKTASSRIDAENMRQVLPDIELVKQILVSSILSPNDMMSNELTYESTANDLGAMKEPLLKVIRDYFTDTYKITELLPKWLEEALFVSGAHPIAILPETTIDDLINGNSRVAMENAKHFFTDKGVMKGLGLLGNPVPTGGTGFGLEALSPLSTEEYNPSAGDNLHVMIHDNYDAVKLPRLMTRVSQERVNDVYTLKKMGLESYKGDTNAAKRNPYPHRSFKQVTVATARTLGELERPTVGHPVVFNFPSESVIPIFAPSEPDKHFAYWVALDTYGHCIKARANDDFYGQLQYSKSSLRDMNSELLAQTRRASEGKMGSVNENIIIEEHQRVYGDILEEQLMRRLDSGAYKGLGLKVGRNDELYSVMLARSFQRMTTQLVLIPQELMVYIAFTFNDFGVGKSLLEDTKIIGGLRAVLLFANTNAAVKNCVQHTQVNIVLDPDDPDPDVAVEAFMHDLVRLRHQNLPIGIINPLDISSHLAMAGVQITTEGNDAYPTMKAEVSQISANHVQPDTTLMDTLKDTQLQAAGVPPEIVELSRNVEFATQAVSSNILFAKNCMLKQDTIAGHAGDFIKTYASNSEPLMNDLRGIVKTLRTGLKVKDSVHDDDIVYYFLRSIKVSLPRPDLSQIEMQLAAFQKYSEILDAVLPSFISSDIFTQSNMGSVSESVDTTIAVLKAHYQRRWIQSNNILPELFELVDIDNKSGIAFNLLDQHEHHIKSMSKSLLVFMEKAMLRIKPIDDELNKVREQTGAPEATDTGGGDDTGGDGGDGGDSGGGDDFEDFGGDFGGGDGGDGSGDEGAGDGDGETTDETVDEGADTEDANADAQKDKDAEAQQKKDDAEAAKKEKDDAAEKAKKEKEDADKA